MVTTVWLFKPRSHGRKQEATRARNGAPLLYMKDFPRRRIIFGCPPSVVMVVVLLRRRRRPLAWTPYPFGYRRAADAVTVRIDAPALSMAFSIRLTLATSEQCTR